MCTLISMQQLSHCISLVTSNGLFLQMKFYYIGLKYVLQQIGVWTTYTVWDLSLKPPDDDLVKFMWYIVINALNMLLCYNYITWNFIFTFVINV